MAHLQLTLISGSAAGQNDSCRFTSLGGTIGRSSECDWTLLDKDRYISNTHLTLTFQNNQFVLTDTSSNGVFINNADSPLGKGNTYILQPQDRITLGKFCLQVDQIDVAQDTPYASTPPASDSDLLGLVTGKSDVTPSAASSPLGKEDLGLFDILSGSPASSPAPQYSYKPIEDKKDSFLNFASEEFQPSPPPATSEPETTPSAPRLEPGINNTIPEDWDLDSLTPDDFAPSATPASGNKVIPDDAFDFTSEASDEQKPEHSFADNKPEAPTQPVPIEKPQSFATQNQAPSPPHVPTSQQSSVVGTQEQAGLPKDDFFDALYAKLGLPKEYIATVDRMKFADDIVDILMTSTQGIMSLLAGRSVFKQESRLSLTMIKPQSNNPIKFSLDPSDTLEMLLVKKKPGYMTAQGAYAEAFNDIQLHQMAFLSGLQATLSGVLGELDPKDIEDAVNEKGKSFIGLKASGQKWDAFKAKQDALNKKVNENLNEVLSQHFSDAYEAQINRIKNK